MNPAALSGEALLTGCGHGRFGRRRLGGGGCHLGLLAGVRRPGAALVAAITPPAAAVAAAIAASATTVTAAATGTPAVAAASAAAVSRAALHLGCVGTLFDLLEKLRRDGRLAFDR